MNKTKRKIFETSMELFAKKGYDATSVEEITSVVGVAKGTLYYHFSSKEEIFNFLVEEGIKLLKNSIEIKTQKCDNYIDKLNVDIKEDVIVKGNPAKLSQVVTNIVVNAIQAYEDKGGEINLKVENSTKEVVISVEDFAGGIPEHIRESIGKNILTTKGVSGTGFGLYLAYSVIKGAFGGEIRFDTEVGKGTTFYITIPKGK